MWRQWAIFLWLSLRVVLGDEIALSRVGDWWNFLPPGSVPGGPPGAWQQAGFNDSGWLAGRSGFAQGWVTDGATRLPTPASSQPLPAFFRRSFIVGSPDRVQWLTLRISYSDGFVAYLNGREIARRNMSGMRGEFVPYERLADQYHPCGEPEELDVSAFREWLVPGTNTIALQLHASSVLSGAMCLSAELMANFTRAPYLSLSSNQVQIIWRTPVLSDTQVEFGIEPNLGTSWRDTNLVWNHVATITNLLPGTSYFYRVTSAAGAQSVTTEVRGFRTFSTAGPVRFVALGDGGWNSLAQYQIAEVLSDIEPDFVLEAGDIVYPYFTAGWVDLRAFSPYEPQLRRTPFLYALGNHDLYAGVTNYLDAFYLPTNSVSLAEHTLAGTSPEHYYSFDVGDAHFVVLFQPFLGQYKLTPGDAQYRWLTNDLATTQRPWKIACLHVPMNSSSIHRFDDSNANGQYDRLEIREALLPVLSAYGVQLVISGHEHGYERFNPTNGVHALTTAGGGVPLYGFTELDSASALFWARYNCVQVTIAGDTLEARALGTDGQAFDSFTIQRALPPPTNCAASWFSPLIESRVGDDGDGNISGQCFNLVGSPIPTLSGRFSNLGRAYVNNDGTNLYVGLEQVMIYGNNNVFLFIESPHLVGVSDLRSVGNGLLDPAGQGADGLDVLSNLGFRNFTPAIGCILGDEYGDGQFRNFARKSLGLNIGQGVFRLDASLSDVPGIRLQQFNLCPQIGGAIGEENANFIELSIPLAELGSLQPGETIRLGAVVAGADFDPIRQTRDLDTGFLGASLLGSGMGPVFLEGIPVRLAGDPAADQDGDGLTDQEELAVGTDPTQADTDSDGLLDGWEALHQLDPRSATARDGANGDPDGDGFPNLQEFGAGTDPHDPSSLLQVGWERRGPALWISWRAMPGQSYRLQRSTVGRPQFHDMPGAEFAPSSVQTNLAVQIRLDETSPAGQFFRVRTIPVR